MRRIPSALIRLALGIAWRKSSYANAKQIFGLPDTDSNHASPASLARYGSDDIHSPSPSRTLHHDKAAMTSRPTKLGAEGVTSSALLDARQQEPITDACTAPSTIYVGQASCLPFVADSTSWVCVTSTSTSVGCNIGGDTISTTRVSTTSVAARCAQTSCAACLPLTDTPPAPVTVDCKNCSTTGGLVFAAPITTLPSAYNSGQAIATGSTTQSAVSDPAMATGSTIQPAISDPAMATGSSTQPAVSDPAMVTGSTIQSVGSDPAMTTGSTTQPVGSDPSSTAPAVLGGRDVGTKVAPAAESKLRGFIRAIRDFPRSLGRYVDNLNMKESGAPDITAWDSLSPSAVPSKPTRTPEKRSLLQPQDYPDGHDDFMVKEVEQAANVDMLVYHRPPSTGGRSSAKVKGFRTNGLNLAVDKLNACTSVVVVSRKGGYISHIWEVPTMMDEQLFQEDVLFGLFEGDDSGYLPGISDHSHDASLFNTLKFGETQNVIQPIIVTPWIDPGFWGDESRPWRFMHEIQRTKDQLQEMFRVEPIVQTYKLLEGVDGATAKNELETTAHGKVVIQYDPRQYLPTEEVTDSQGQQHTCVKQYAALRVYADVNQKPIYEDTWLAMPEQASEWDPEDSDQRNQQPLRLHKLRIRDESQQIVIYGCVKLDPGDSSGCSACTSEGGCTLDPNEDQGQDGTLSTSAPTCPACTSPLCGLDPDDDQGENGTPPTSGPSCTACTSGTCGLDPNDPQGEEGYPPSIGNGTSSGWNTTTSSNSSTATITPAPCSLVTPTSGVVNGTSYTGGPACGCGSSTGPVKTTTGSDSKMTYFCPNGPTTVPVSTANSTSSRPTTTSPSCSVITQPGGVINNVWVPSSEACACGSMTTDLVTQLGWNGSETLFCGNGTDAVAIGTTTQSATAGLSGCSISRQPAQTITSLGVVTLPAQETCKCAGGQQAPVTTWKDGNSWYIGCVHSSTVVTVTTASGPFITSCSVTNDGIVSQSATTSSRGWMCHCNDGLTTPAVSSTFGEGIGYACPTTAYPKPVTTVPISGCMPSHIEPMTVALSGQPATTYTDHWTCGCGDGRNVDAITSRLDNFVTAVGCATNISETSYVTTAIQTPSSCTITRNSQGPYCECDGDRPGSLVTTSGNYYCTLDGYTQSSTTLPGPTVTMTPVDSPTPTPTQTSSSEPEIDEGTCRLHVRQALRSHEGNPYSPHTFVNVTVSDWEMRDFFNDQHTLDFCDPAFAIYTAPLSGWALIHNMTVDICADKDNLKKWGLDKYVVHNKVSNFTQLKDIKDDHETNPYIYSLEKLITFGDVKWSSLMNKDTIDLQKPHCSLGGWADSDVEIDGTTYDKTQDFDCWFPCAILKTGTPAGSGTPPNPLDLGFGYGTSPPVASGGCKLHLDEWTRPSEDGKYDPEVKFNITVWEPNGAVIWQDERIRHFHDGPITLLKHESEVISVYRTLAEEMTLDLAVGEGKDDYTQYKMFDKGLTYGNTSWTAKLKFEIKPEPYCWLGSFGVQPFNILDTRFKQKQLMDCWFPCEVVSVEPKYPKICAGNPQACGLNSSPELVADE